MVDLAVFNGSGPEKLKVGGIMVILEAYRYILASEHIWSRKLMIKGKTLLERTPAIGSYTLSSKPHSSYLHFNYPFTFVCIFFGFFTYCLSELINPTL